MKCQLFCRHLVTWYLSYNPLWLSLIRWHFRDFSSRIVSHGRLHYFASSSHSAHRSSDQFLCLLPADFQIKCHFNCLPPTLAAWIYRISRRSWITKVCFPSIFYFLGFQLKVTPRKKHLNKKENKQIHRWSREEAASPQRTAEVRRRFGGITVHWPTCDYSSRFKIRKMYLIWCIYYI